MRTWMNGRAIGVSIVLTSLCLPATPAGAQTAPGKGQFTLVFDPIKQTGHRQWERLFKDTTSLQASLNAYNEALVLPATVRVRFKEVPGAAGSGPGA